jgi:glucose-6-phosphate dehydrogenase assembly protein OpcA
MGASIQPERILSELDQLWVGLGGEAQEDGSVGVLRACSLTMFALSSSAREDDLPTESFAALLEEHPGRFISIRISEGGGRSLDARVSAQCWTPFGKRRHICVEQVDIDASRAGIGDLSPVLRALRVPDLPALLWCRDARLLDDDEAAGLTALCDKVILNSSGYHDPGRMLERLLHWRDNNTVVADLSWTRLSRWRETIAQLFASQTRRERLREASDVTVTYYGDRPPLRAAYLAAWFRSILGDGLNYELVSAGDLEPCQQKGEVQAASIQGPGLDLTIQQLGGETVELRLGDLVNQTVFHEVDEHQLLRQELSIEGRDAIFESALDNAADFL